MHMVRMDDTICGYIAIGNRNLYHNMMLEQKLRVEVNNKATESPTLCSGEYVKTACSNRERLLHDSHVE